MPVFSRIICIFLFFLCVVADIVSSDCYITVPSGQQSAPRLGRWLGLNWLKVPSTNTRVDIYGTVYAECPYGFSAPHYGWLRETSSISIRCVDDRWFRVFIPNNENDAEYHYREWFWSGETFSCSGPNLQLYQSSEAFDWCESHGESYFIKAHLLNGQEHILAYFCYDVEIKKFHAISYKSSPKHLTAEHEMIFPNWNNTNANGVGLEDFQRVLSHSSAAQELRDERSKNMWLELANYDYSPVVQTGAYAKFFNQFNAALNILWWPSLLHGNWHRFNEALEKQASKVEYTLTTGTSGVAEIPHRDPLTGRLELEKFSFGSINSTIPKYIWTLGIADNRQDDFLVIGYNSPFFELANKTDVIFCEDICDQYEWLKDARSTFSYSFIGITFCCALEEAIDVLEGLPIAEDFFNPARPANQTTSLDESVISPTIDGFVDNCTAT